MKDNYNIKTNIPELSAEQIKKHQDFDALFAQRLLNGLDENLRVLLFQKSENMAVLHSKMHFFHP